jgi:hypothetical protein
VVAADQLWSVTADALPDGIHRFIVFVSDAAGNMIQTEHMLTIDSVAPPVVVDDKVPAITKMSVTPRRVRFDGGHSVSLSRRGPVVRVSLSEAATIRFRMTGKHFRARTFLVQRNGGASRVRIPRKIRKRLDRGRYRITAIATDSIGQVSEVKRTSFRVTR